MNDWFPTKEQNLVDLCRKWIEPISNPTIVENMGWNPAACTSLVCLIDRFTDARATYISDNSTANRICKDKAKKDLTTAMRKFANSYVRYNDAMSEAERGMMGIHTRDASPTAHPRPTSQPTTVVENTVNHYEHLVKANCRGKKPASRPEDAYGMRIAWQVGGERPSEGMFLPRSMFSRKMAVVISHTESDKGRPAYYATCYENQKGEAGPWSPVTEAYIA